MRSAAEPPPYHDDASGVATLTLPALTDSVPMARRFVGDALTMLDAAGARDDAVAMVSELATNAVIHARTGYTVVVNREGDTIRVGVRDRSPVLPRRRSYGLDATTGRGLRLVATMSSDWGIDVDGGGKVVWFEVPCEGSPTATAWYDDVDVEALLSAFDDVTVPDRPSPASVVTA